MEIIDEIIPLNEQDIQFLKTKQFTSIWGCGVLFLVLMPVPVLIIYLYFLDKPVVIAVLALVSVFCLFLAIQFFRAKKFENGAVTLDLQQGVKRRIAAPIEKKEVIDVTRRPHPLNIKKRIIKADQETKLKYFMYICGKEFEISEDQYLSGERQGDFMEFSIAPNSNIIISQPVKFEVKN